MFVWFSSPKMMASQCIMIFLRHSQRSRRSRWITALCDICHHRRRFVPSADKLFTLTGREVTPSTSKPTDDVAFPMNTTLILCSALLFQYCRNCLPGFVPSFVHPCRKKPECAHAAKLAQWQFKVLPSKIVLDLPVCYRVAVMS